jgi:hypothetical protein
MKSAARATVIQSGWQIAIYRPGGRGREGRGEEKTDDRSEERGGV